MQQNRTLIFIDLKILFEPMSVIAGTLCYVGTLLLHLCLMRLMFCMLLCMLGFDDLWCMYGAIDCMLRVFDPGRLLVVRGELQRINHELRVFDPGRLLVIRVGNLNELTTS